MTVAAIGQRARLVSGEKHSMEEQAIEPKFGKGGIGFGDPASLEPIKVQKPKAALMV